MGVSRSLCSKIKREVMKLELKHLAPYLPYGLKVKSKSDIEGVYVHTMNEHNIGCVLEEAITEYKPILRPLSDLGSKIPLTEKEELAIKAIILGDTHQYGNLSYYVILFLSQHHYDFQNLIEKGLAIDTNTIK